MQNSFRSPRNHHHCEIFICTSRRATLCGLPSANLTKTWPGLSRTWMLECSIDKHVLRKKLFVDESRSANLACSTEGLEDRDAIRGPWPLFQPVGRPAPTGPVRFLDVRPGQHPRDGNPLHMSILPMSRGIQPRNAMPFASNSKSSDARCECHPYRYRTSSVLRRLNRVDLHEFRIRGPGEGNNRRLSISLDDP